MKHDTQHSPSAGNWVGHDNSSSPHASTAASLTPLSDRPSGKSLFECRRQTELLHALFERQAELQPHTLALCGGQVCWSYGEVEGRANQLAHLLRSRGVRPGTLAGVYMPRSAEAIVALLGILKAGGAYVPIDPEYPQDWVAKILDDSDIQLLVTLSELAYEPPSGAVQAICLDEMRECLSEYSTERIEPYVRPTDPAYVIYTSGSTGNPQGVVVEHRNIMYSTRCRLQYYKESIGRFALIPSLSFDASVATIFWTLSQGGTLHVPAAGLERDPMRLSRWIEAHQITHWLSVPALYQLLLDQPSERLRSLRVVILGGESCPTPLVRTHYRTLSHAGLYNEYGPTEAAVWSSVHACLPDQPSEEMVPIGRPLVGTQLMVLNEHGRPVAAGEPGELYIEGPGVARGYLKNAGLTTERFLASQDSGTMGERVYRTGDRVKQLADGSFVFLGRLDDQIKVRGHRVDIAQVEAVLGGIDEVAQVAVVAQHRRNHNQLLAFVVPRGGTHPSVSRLRDVLRASLPSFMVPSQILLRERLPLTSRGKVDRQALLGTDLLSTQPTTLPADETESRLIACWEDVFGLRPIQASDDFFELGGDSLIAAALFARMEVTFGQTLPPETLLEHPTVSTLAQLLAAPSESKELSSAVRIHAGPHQPPLFCLPGIGGHVLEFRELAGQLRTRHAVYGLRPAGLEDGCQPHSSIEAMAAHAIDQMRRVQRYGPYALIGYSLGGVVAFEMARQLVEIGQEIKLLALLDSRLWSPSKPLSLWQRLRLHSHNLIHSSGNGGLNYLCERGRLLAARIRRLSLRPSEDDVVLGLGLSATSRRVAHTHLHAWRDYRPNMYDGDVSLFVARQHYCAPEEERSDPTLGWSQSTRGDVNVIRLNATHAEMLRPESSKALATAIESILSPRR